MRAMQVRSFLCVLLLGTVVPFTTGCPSDVEESYSLEERIPAMEDSLSRTVRYANGSIPDLYVAEDEYSFDKSHVTSEAAALFDISGRETLYSKETFEQLYSASTIKVITALIAVKDGDLNTRVAVTSDTAITEFGAILCGIKPGDILILGQLLHGLMLPSGNDADAAIAVHTVDSIDKFADMMNRKAASLGATGTRSAGLHRFSDPGHYITVYDLYLTFDKTLKYPVFRQIVGTISHMAGYHDEDSQAVTRTWKGGNWFMIRERETPEGPTVFGGKTGTTNAAGHYLIMATRGQGSKEHMSVALRSDNRPGLYDSMTNIISKTVK